MAQPAPLFRDDFHLKENNFSLPENTINLDPGMKRAWTICNLFVHHQLSIQTIARVLDEDLGNIVLALLKHGIIHDRRHKDLMPPLGINRRLSRGSKMVERTRP